MKTIERYVLRSFLTALLLSLLVLTFVLSIGLLVKVASLIAKGMPVSFVSEYFLTGIPETLGFTIPLAVLTASLLVFGRLSTDSEIAAMRACGINLLRVLCGPLLVALGLSVVGYYLHAEVAPRSEEARALLVLSTTSNLGLDMMEPGVFNEGPNHLKIWFASRKEDWLTDLRIYDKTKSGLDREIRAARARVTRSGSDLKLDLYDATLDPIDDEHPGGARAGRYQHTIEDAFKPANRPRKIRTSGSGELLDMLSDARALRRSSANAAAIVQACPDCSRRDAKGKACCRNPVHELARTLLNASGASDPVTARRLKETCPACRARTCADPNHTRLLLAADAAARVAGLPMEIVVELNKRAVLGCAAFCFALIGMPLGIRTHRRESTVGVAIGLGIAILFYLCMITVDALKRTPQLHPELLAWIPVVTCVALAAWLIPRNQ